MTNFRQYTNTAFDFFRNILDMVFPSRQRQLSDRLPGHGDPNFLFLELVNVGRGSWLPLLDYFSRPKRKKNVNEPFTCSD